MSGIPRPKFKINPSSQSSNRRASQTHDGIFSIFSMAYAQMRRLARKCAAYRTMAIKLRAASP